MEGQTTLWKGIPCGSLILLLNHSPSSLITAGPTAVCCAEPGVHTTQLLLHTVPALSQCPFDPDGAACRDPPPRLRQPHSHWGTVFFISSRMVLSRRLHTAVDRDWESCWDRCSWSCPLRCCPSISTRSSLLSNENLC